MTYSLHYISWRLPRKGWVKLNYDGSVNQHLQGSCGGLLRDSLGLFLHGFAVNLDICPITVVKV